MLHPVNARSTDGISPRANTQADTPAIYCAILMLNSYTKRSGKGCAYNHRWPLHYMQRTHTLKNSIGDANTNRLKMYREKKKKRNSTLLQFSRRHRINKPTAQTPFKWLYDACEHPRLFFVKNIFVIFYFLHI